MPKSLQKGKVLFILAMVGVSVVGFLVFYVAKNINSILMAFQQIAGYDEEGKVTYKYTLDNFAMFFREMKYPDTQIFMAFRNTLKYFVLQTIIMFPVSYIISYFLYKRIWGHKVFRVIFFLTSIISSIVVITIYKSFIKVQGPLYIVMKNLFGYRIPSLLDSAKTATGTIMAYVLWTGLAGNFILLLGAMNRIPEELRDAMALDGCGWVRELFQMVTPLCWSTTSTLLILSFIGIFNASGPILLFNTPEYTWTIAHWMYMQVTTGSFSYPSAVGLFLTVVSLPIVLTLIWVMRRFFAEVEY